MKKLFLLILLFTNILNAQDTLVFKADYIPYPDTTLVFLPAEYDAQSPLPLLFLLHGWTGYYSYWNEITDVQKLADEFGFMIVCPEGFDDSWYMNNFERKNMQYELFFWNDLVPKLFENYKIDRANIFISGLSMGGHGAMYLFLKNPSFFNSAGSMSGILDLVPFSTKYGLPDVLGNIDVNPQRWENNSTINMLKNIEGTDRRIIFDCGTEDFAYDVNYRFYERCRELGIDAKFISQPGNHSRNYWKNSIIDHLHFFNSLVNGVK